MSNDVPSLYAIRWWYKYKIKIWYKYRSVQSQIQTTNAQIWNKHKLIQCGWMSNEMPSSYAVRRWYKYKIQMWNKYKIQSQPGTKSVFWPALMNGWSRSYHNHHDHHDHDHHHGHQYYHQHDDDHHHHYDLSSSDQQQRWWTCWLKPELSWSIHSKSETGCGVWFLVTKNLRKKCVNFCIKILR